MIQLLTDGVARLEIGDYLLDVTLGEPDVSDDRRIPSTFTLWTSEGLQVDSGPGSSSGAHGIGVAYARDALASLLSFMSAECERRRSAMLRGYSDGDGSIFPDATPGFLLFLDEHEDDIAIEGAEWEENR